MNNSKIITQVVNLCDEVLHDLRATPEEKWTPEDEGIFHLAGAFLLLYREIGFHKNEVRQLLIASADACTTTIRKYHNVLPHLWTDYDKSLNLICNVYMQLFTEAVRAKKINVGDTRSTYVN